MNKTTWIVIAVIIILILGFVLLNKSEDTSSTNQQTQTIENAPDSAFTNLETSDDVFSEIDNTLEFIG